MTKKAPLVMIPGPTPVSERVRAAMSAQTYGHTYGEFVSIYSECLNGLKKIFQADHMIVVGGSGFLALEMALVNTVAPGEEILIVSHGFFGDKLAAIAKTLGIKTDLLTCPAGEKVPLAQIESRLAAKKYAALTLTHVDTSTGVAAQPEEVGMLAKKYDCLFILDGVCASAALPEHMKEYGIDIIATTCQKAFAVPPGLAMLALNEKALARREKLDKITTFYGDWKNWLPIMDNPALYFSTPPVNHIAALNQSVQMILEEGLENRYMRHKLLGEAMRAGLAAVGFIPVTAAEALAPTLSVVKYPANVDDAAFRAKMEKNGVFIAGALGDLKGKACRFGHMGSIGMDEVAIAMTAVERSLAAQGVKTAAGAAVGAAWQAWDK